MLLNRLYAGFVPAKNKKTYFLKMQQSRLFNLQVDTRYWNIPSLFDSFKNSCKEQGFRHSVRADQESPQAGRKGVFAIYLFPVARILQQERHVGVSPTDEKRPRHSFLSEECPKGSHLHVLYFPSVSASREALSPPR